MIARLKKHSATAIMVRAVTRRAALCGVNPRD
jgi:hypothetical protein